MCRNETISGFGVPHTLGDFRFPSCLTLGLSPQGSQSRGHRAGRPMQAVASLSAAVLTIHHGAGGVGVLLGPRSCFFLVVLTPCGALIALACLLIHREPSCCSLTQGPCPGAWFVLYSLQSRFVWKCVPVA